MMPYHPAVQVFYHDVFNQWLSGSRMLHVLYISGHNFLALQLMWNSLRLTPINKDHEL